jgi:hypothetical protein
VDADHIRIPCENTYLQKDKWQEGLFQMEQNEERKNKVIGRLSEQ